MFLGCAHGSTYFLTFNPIVFELLNRESRKRFKTVVWTQINRLVVDDNKNAYFWKRIIVDRAFDLKNNSFASTSRFFVHCNNNDVTKCLISRVLWRTWKRQLLFFKESSCLLEVLYKENTFINKRELKQRRRRKRKKNGNENGKKSNTNKLRLVKKTLHMHHAFLYISLLSVQHCYVKIRPRFTLCGERQHKKTTFFFFSWTSIQSLRITP